MAEEIKKGIDGTEFTFREAEVPRKELIRSSRRPQALVSETPEANDEVQNRTSEDHYRVTCYYTSIDKVVAEITRGEKFDLAKICMRGKLVANLATKFALSLHASIFEVCNPLDLQQICQRFARVQIHK